MKDENCPCCPNHCPVDHLGCGRGKKHFNNQNQEKRKEPKTLSEQVIMDLRKCSHMLHHNKELNIDELLSEFTDEELNKLHELLCKIHNNNK